jgi:hypothetical protein
MLEEAVDPRPPQDQFARFLANQLGAAASGPQTVESWLRGWNDRDSVYTNLRNIEHWIERARR